MAGNDQIEALLKEAEALQNKGQGQAAVGLIERILGEDPEHSKALHTMGSIFAVEGDIPKAEAFIRRAISSDPGDALAHHSLATLLRLTNRHAEALAALEQALKNDPENPQILLSLGEVCNAFGKYQDAAKCLIRANRLAPGNTAILVPLAKALSEVGALADALQAAQSAINLAPESIKALEVAAEVSFRAGKVMPVIQCFERLIALKPEEKRYYQDLSHLYEKTHQFEKAYETFKKLMENSAATSGDYAKMGEYAYYSQRADEAIEHLKHGLSLDPGNAQALTFLGRCHSALGEKDVAKDYFQQAVSAKPDHINAYFFLSELTPFDPADPAFEVLEDVKAGDDLKIGDRSAVGFALGRMYQGAGDYDKAFENFQRGNECSAEYFAPIGYKFDREELDQVYAMVTALFSEKNRKKFNFRGFKSNKPVFILGMPRSGTTLLEQIMAAHSKVSTAGELSDLTAAHLDLLERTKTMEGPGREGAILSLLEGEGEKIAAAYLETLAKKGGGTPLVIDKMPQNFLQIGLISVLFPNARIIHMKRNPLDVGLSIFTNQFYGDWTFSHDLEHIGFYYRKYAELMEKWKKTIDIPILDVEYEALLDDPEGIAKGVIEFCGLKWQPDCLEFYKNRGRVFTTSVMQVRNPINKSAVGKWKPYEKHLKPLKKALGKFCP